MSSKRVRVCALRMPEFNQQSDARRLFDFIPFLKRHAWSVTFLVADNAGKNATLTYSGSKEWLSICNRQSTLSQATSTWLCWRSGMWPNGFSLSYATSHLIRGYSSMALISTSSAIPSVSVPEPVTMRAVERTISALSQRSRYIRRAARWNGRIAHSAGSARSVATTMGSRPACPLRVEQVLT